MASTVWVGSRAKWTGCPSCTAAHDLRHGFGPLIAVVAASSRRHVVSIYAGVFRTDCETPSLCQLKLNHPTGYTVAAVFLKASDKSSNYPFDAVYTIDLNLSQTTTVTGACNDSGSFDAGDDCTGPYNDFLRGGTLMVTNTYDKVVG